MHTQPKFKKFIFLLNWSPLIINIHATRRGLEIYSFFFLESRNNNTHTVRLNIQWEPKERFRNLPQELNLLSTLCRSFIFRSRLSKFHLEIVKASNLLQCLIHTSICSNLLNTKLKIDGEIKKKKKKKFFFILFYFSKIDTIR